MKNDKSFNIVAIDQSLSCSGLVMIQGEDVKNTTIQPKKLRGAERLSFIIDKLFEFYTKSSGDILVMEGYSFGSRGRATFSLGELGGVIKYEAFKRGIELFVVPPSTWKKGLFGKGNLKKDQIMKETYKKFNMDFDNDNVCDAYCLSKFIEQYMLWLNNKGEHTKYSVDVFKAYQKIENAN